LPQLKSQYNFKTSTGFYNVILQNKDEKKANSVSEQELAILPKSGAKLSFPSSLARKGYQREKGIHTRRGDAFNPVEMLLFGQMRLQYCLGKK
jgi:hypothetical protein